MNIKDAQPPSWSTRQGVLSYLYTSVFCVFGALLLWLSGVNSDLSLTLLVSFTIGLSINTAFILLTRWVKSVLNPLATAIVTSSIGLGIGLLLAGWLLNSDALFFFSTDYNSLVVSIFLGVAGYIYVTTQSALAETKSRLVEQDKLQVETELRLLQAQIEPHFLFNTLANISSLIQSDPAAAQLMLNSLTTFLRASLQRTRDSGATLENEVELVRTYLSIQKMRMGDRLTFGIRLEADLEATPFPSLLLQPLVENAVIHGIEPAEAGGHVSVIVSVKGDMLSIQVSDNGVGLSQSSHGTKMGLSNIKQRIGLLFGDAATLEFTEGKHGGIMVVLQLPYVQTD